MNYWLWVAKSDACIGIKGEKGEWRDCGGKVEPGDLVLIYRRSPYHKPYDKSKFSIIECLARVKSIPTDGRRVITQSGVPKTGWGCDYEVLHKFENGLRYKELISHKNEHKSALSDWNALKKNLRGMYHPIDEDSWNKLNELLISNNKTTYKGFNSFLDSN